MPLTAHRQLSVWRHPNRHNTIGWHKCWASVTDSGPRLNWHLALKTNKYSISIFRSSSLPPIGGLYGSFSKAGSRSMQFLYIPHSDVAKTSWSNRVYSLSAREMSTGTKLPTRPLVRSLVKIPADQYTFMAVGSSCPANISLQSYPIAHCKSICLTLTWTQIMIEPVMVHLSECFSCSLA